MNVTLLSHDLGMNCFGRAHVLAQLASRFAQVEIVGPSSTGQVWGPLRADTSIRTRIVRGTEPTTAEVLSGEPTTLYAIKTRRASLGAGLRAARAANLPLVADSDDWETAFYYENPKWWLRQSLNLRDANSYWRTLWAQRAIRSADAVTVSSSFLQSRFGGTVIVHARDSAWLDPARHTGDAVRAEFGLGDRPVVLFMGSARPHKGLQDVVDAFEAHRPADAVFLVVGDGMTFAPRPWLRQIGNQPYAKLPEILAAANAVVIAQRRGYISRAQVPAKLFDAMAMGVAIVTTSVSDAPTIVADAGLIVMPGDIPAIGSAISRLVREPVRSTELGFAARQRFVEHYSFDAVAPKLEQIFIRASQARPRR